MEGGSSWNRRGAVLFWEYCRGHMAKTKGNYSSFSLGITYRVRTALFPCTKVAFLVMNRQLKIEVTVNIKIRLCEFLQILKVGSKLLFIRFSITLSCNSVVLTVALVLQQLQINALWLFHRRPRIKQFNGIKTGLITLKIDRPFKVPCLTHLVNVISEEDII